MNKEHSHVEIIEKKYFGKTNLVGSSLSEIESKCKVAENE